jgi:hypothetical protein
MTPRPLRLPARSGGTYWKWTVTRRWMANLEGFEPSDTTANPDMGLGSQQPGGAAESGAVPARLTPPDHDLALIVTAWPDLPAHLRAAVLALVKSAGEGPA